MSDCGCEADTKRAGVDPAYRRALWIVVILNVGFGLFELVGGFIANSQALKADSLDFIGIAALVVNISAALVLARFRGQGDATARAIWLFSRNDALANIAVILAAALVGWTGQAWPDLVVAGVIALLFLHSAYDIIRDARRELAEHARARA